MGDFLKKCEEYFDTRDFYEVLKIPRDASENQIKKAYHKLSLLVHPDRVEENHKKEATEKFKVLSRIHSILQDSNKRKIYNETGDFDEESDKELANWMAYWRNMFKKISLKDIHNYEKEYIGSETELRDIKKAYLSRKGDMDHILEMVPFSSCDGEPRIIEIVRKMVDDGEVEEYPKFFNESQQKKDRRRAKWDAERKEVEDIDMDELEREINLNQERRASAFMNLLNKYSTPENKKRKSIKGKEDAKASPARKRSKKATSPAKTRTTRSSRK